MAYPTLADLAACGLPPTALATISNADKTQALEDNSALADTYIGDKYQLPLSAPYDRALIRMICYLAAWDLLGLRGYNPSDPTDQVVQYKADQAMKFLIRVAEGQARLNVTQGAPAYYEADVYTNTERGFNDGGDGTTTGTNWGE